MAEEPPILNIVHEDLDASGDLDSMQVKVEYCEVHSPLQPSRETSDSDDSFKINLQPIKLFDTLPSEGSRQVDMAMIEQIKQRRLRQLAEQ